MVLTLSWILDVVLIALVLGTIVFYTKRGFIRSVLGFGKKIVSLALAWFVGPKLGVPLVNRFLGNAITGKIYNMLCSAFDAGTESLNVGDIIDGLPDAFVALMRLFGTDVEALKSQYGEMTQATRENLVAVSENISAPILTFLGNVIGFLLVFLVAYLTITLLSGILGKIFELPILKQINGLLGFLLGIICSVLFALIFCTLSYYIIKCAGTLSGKFDGVEWMKGARIFSFVLKYKFF